MKQNLIKTFAILVLAAINLFLLISLTNQMSQIKYYDENLIGATIENMKANGMIANESLIPRVREKFSVLEGVYDTGVMISEAKRFLGSGDVSVYALPSGAVYVSDGNGGYTRFDRNMDFAYCSSGFGETLSTLPTASAEADDPDRFIAPAREFLVSGSGGSDNGSLSMTAVAVSYYPENDVYAVECQEIAEGLPIYGFVATVYIKDGEIRAADGKWCFSKPRSKINAETQDVISILINESGRLRTEYRAALKDDPEAFMPAYIVSDISANYYIFSDDDGDIYYVPVYVISYQDRNGSVYNTVNGKMISVTGESGAEQ